MSLAGSFFRGFKERGPRCCIIGFASHWTWIWCVFWSSLFYSGESSIYRYVPFPLGATGIEPLWVVSLLFNVLALAGLLFIVVKRHVLADQRWLPVVASLTTALGTLLISDPLQHVIVGYAAELYGAGSVLTGLGSAVVVVLWAELLGALGSRQTLQLSIAAMLLAALSYEVVLLLPVPVAQLISALLPVFDMLLYLRARAASQTQLRVQRGRRGSSGSWGRLCLIAFLFGLSFGVMKGFMVPVTDEWIDLRDMLNIVAIVVGVLALHLTSSVLRMDFDQLTYQVALPLMAAGFLFLPLQEPASVIGTAVHQCGYQYFHIVLWAVWPIIASHGDEPVGKLACASTLAIQVGQFVGSVTSSVAVGAFSDDLGKAMFSSVAVFVLLLAALFVFGNRSATTGWGSSRLGDEKSPVEDAGAIAQRLSHNAGLSPREAEVFALLARGRTRAYIGRELTIGDETVKSHVKNIYRKMGLHSQQEAIDLLDREVQRLREGRRSLEDVG